MWTDFFLWSRSCTILFYLRVSLCLYIQSDSPDILAQFYLIISNNTFIQIRYIYFFWILNYKKFNNYTFYTTFKECPVAVQNVFYFIICRYSIAKNYYYYYVHHLITLKQLVRISIQNLNALQFFGKTSI